MLDEDIPSSVATVKSSVFESQKMVHVQKTKFTVAWNRGITQNEEILKWPAGTYITLYVKFSFSVINS